MSTHEDPTSRPAVPAADEQVVRAFTWRSAFSVAFAFISPIVALYGIFALTFAAAGPAMWWAFVIVLVAQVLVAAVFGELASRWPFAGGVYAWARRLGGETYGWFAGWAYMWTLMIAIGSAAYIANLFVPVVLGVGPFSPGTMVVAAVIFILVGTGLNLLGHVGLKIVAFTALIVELIGSVGIGAYLLIAGREQPFSVIFESHGSGIGSGPWVWSGLAAAMAFVGWAFVGFESAGDIAEEVSDPERAVPRAMLASIALVGVVVLFSALAVILSIPDIDAVMSGESADPVAETIVFHLGEGVVRPLFAMFVFAFLATFVTAQAAASRVMWSFARDGVLPGSDWLKHLSGDAKIPARAILVTGAVPILVVLSSLWGAGYATMALFAIAGFYIAFAFPLVALSRQRLQGTWQPGVFNLGVWGTPLTLIATVWILFQLINIVWPRDAAAPWYITYGVLIMVIILGVLGLAVWWTRRDAIARAEEVIEAEAASSGTSPR